jgi:hypothetical protein
MSLYYQELDDGTIVSLIPPEAAEVMEDHAAKSGGRELH